MRDDAVREEYRGTVKQNGFFWTNPFYTRQKISLRARNFDSERVKVNDQLGNPIMISVILVWRVENTYQAAFEVDDYQNFVRVQSDAAVRKLANSYPYDNFNDTPEITLVSGVDEVNDALEERLSDRLKMAGIKVIEARIGYLGLFFGDRQCDAAPTAGYGHRGGPREDRGRSGEHGRDGPGRTLAQANHRDGTKTEGPRW